MTELFNKCVKIILEQEGGYNNDPFDLGGPTNYGITQRVYDKYKEKFKDIPTQVLLYFLQSVELITKEEVLDIYWEEYWKPMNLDSIDDESSALELFDMGVNAGIRTAIKIAQKLVKAIPDGILGPKTVFAINDYGSNFVTEYKEARRMYYVDIVIRRPLNIKFLKGWLKRVYNTKLK